MLKLTKAALNRCKIDFVGNRLTKKISNQATFELFFNIVAQ